MRLGTKWPRIVLIFPFLFFIKQCLLTLVWRKMKNPNNNEKHESWFPWVLHVAGLWRSLGFEFMTLGRIACLSFFSSCCDKALWDKKLKGEPVGFSSVQGWSPSLWEGQGVGAWSGRPHLICTQEAEVNKCMLLLSTLCPFHKSRIALSRRWSFPQSRWMILHQSAYSS